MLFFVAVDGYIIHGIPIRFKQRIGLVYAFAAVYWIWIAIHYISGIGRNPALDEETKDDDAIYPMINFKKNPELGAALAVVTFLGIPFLFLVTLGISFCIPKRTR